MTTNELINKQLERITFKEIVALIVVLFCFWLQKMILFNELSATAEKFAQQILTGLNPVLTLVLGYWFISSSSAARKDATIAAMLPPSPQAVPETLTLTWLGNFDQAPGNPAEFDAYVNTIDNKNYYWNKTQWIVTTQKPS